MIRKEECDQYGITMTKSIVYILDAVSFIFLLDVVGLLVITSSVGILEILAIEVFNHS